MDIETELALAERDALTWSCYVRSKSGGDPYLMSVADMLNPRGDSEWRLVFKPRGKGNPEHGSRKGIKDIYIASRVRQELERLNAEGRPSAQKAAEGIVADEFGIADRTVRQACARAKMAK